MKDLCVLSHRPGAVLRAFLLQWAPDIKYDARAICAMNHQEIVMNKDQVKGRVKAAAGTVKEVAGKIVGSARLQVKGNLQKAAGSIQARYGDLKNACKKSY